MTMFKNIIANFNKYSFLMGQLILRDFKVKYKRSVLGVVWSLLSNTNDVSNGNCILTNV